MVAMLLFLFWLIVICVAWIGYQRLAIALYVVALIVSTIWFNHNVTEHLKIQL